MFQINNNNKPKISKKKFPFSQNKIYIIYYDPPFTFIRQANKILIKVFKKYVQEWTIEYNGQIGKVKAILTYYGLPLKKHKTPGAKIDDPNLESLEKTSDVKLYHFAKLLYIFLSFENLKEKDVQIILESLFMSKGKPIKVLELENKKLPDNIEYIKGTLWEVYSLLQKAKNLSITNIVEKGRNPLIVIFSDPAKARAIFMLIITVIIIFVLFYVFGQLGNLTKNITIPQINPVYIQLPEGLNTTTNNTTTYEIINLLG